MVVEQEMLSYASCLYGQSLAQNCQGKNAIRRNAMKQFLQSAMLVVTRTCSSRMRIVTSQLLRCCRYAKNANNYDLVITSSRHYWNASLPLINQPIERELLSEPISLLLECISAVTDKDRFKKKVRILCKNIVGELVFRVYLLAFVFRMVSGRVGR